CLLARLSSVVVVGVEVAEDDSGEAAFEAAQGFGRGIARSDAVAVVGLPESVETDLGDCYPVQGGVELAVTRAGHPYPASGVARPHWDWCYPGVAGEGGLAFEPGHSSGLADQFGRGQLPAARKRKQHRGNLAHAPSD